MGKQSNPPPQYQGNSQQQPQSRGGVFNPNNALDAGYWFNPQGGWKDTFDAATFAPNAPDYQGAANAQAAASAANVNAQTGANRPGQSTPFGFSNWTQGPDGRWYQQTGLNGGLNGALHGLLNQSASLGNAMDFGSLGPIDNGSQARQQAIDAAYSQSTSRLNPQWEQASQLNASSLANAGLDPNSAAARAQNLQFQQGKNDAYGSAMNSAILQGNEAGNSVFRNSLMARQQQLAEMLRKRAQPLQELERLQGLTSMPGFNAAGAAETPQQLAAAIASGNFDMNKWQQQMGLLSDTAGGAGELGGVLAKLLPLLMAA